MHAELRGSGSPTPGVSDYFESVRLEIPDAPRPHELVVAAVAADGPRPNARIGDRTTDPKVRLADYDGHPLLEATIP